MEDIKKILEMVRDGKMEVEQAEKLLKEIEVKEEKKKGKIFRIEVEDEEGTKVNVRIPLSAAKILLSTSLIPQQAGGVNIHEIIKHLDELDKIEGDIVNVETEDAKVKIWIE